MSELMIDHRINYDISYICFHHKHNSNDNDKADLYADHPQADKEWTAKYQEVDADKELEQTLKSRLKDNDM